MTSNAAGWDPSACEPTENAPGRAALESAPEPGSWIARNLPDRSCSDDDTDGWQPEDAFSQTDAALVYAAVNSLPDGVVTDAVLDQAGITRDEFNRVTRDHTARVQA